MMQVHYFHESRTSFPANRQPIPALEQECAVKAKENLFSTDKNLLLSLPDPGGSVQGGLWQSRTGGRAQPGFYAPGATPQNDLYSPEGCGKERLFLADQSPRHSSVVGPPP